LPRRAILTQSTTSWEEKKLYICAAPRRGGISSSPVTPGSVTPCGVPSPGATAQRPLRGSRPDRSAGRRQPPWKTKPLFETRRRRTKVNVPGATAQRPLRGSRPDRERWSPAAAVETKPLFETRRRRTKVNVPYPVGRSARRRGGAKVAPVVGKKGNGAGNGIRTRDFNLGKVALYH
jgi:hypothetical protein